MDGRVLQGSGLPDGSRLLYLAMLDDMSVEFTLLIIVLLLMVIFGIGGYILYKIWIIL